MKKKTTKKTKKQKKERKKRTIVWKGVDNKK